MRDDVDTESSGLSDDERVEAAPPPRYANSALPESIGAATMALPGSFVTAFDMTTREEDIAIALAVRQLSPLLAECDPEESDSPERGAGWRRVRGKKGSRVRLWEKGSASTLSAMGTEGRMKRLRRKSLPMRSKKNKRLAASPEETPPAVKGDGIVEDSFGRQIYAVRSSISVHASVAMVLKALDCSVATSYRSFTKIIYEQLVTETSVLTHRRLSQVDAKHPHVGDGLAVRWVVCKCANPLASDCDLCLLEYTKVHSIDELLAAGAAPSNNNEAEEDSEEEEDDGFSPPRSDGLRNRQRLPTAYKILQSLETKHCPELNAAPHHLVRVQIPLGGFLLYATDNADVTDVVFFMSVAYERTSSRPSSSFLSSDDRQFRAIQQLLHQMALSIGRLDNAVDAYAMSLQLETIRSTRWIENSDRAECFVCYRRFHPIARRRHHCRLCGDVICRDCSIHKDADLPTVGPTTLRICKLCNARHFGRSSAPASIAMDVTETPDKLEQERVLDTMAFDSPSATRNRRQTVMSIDTSTKASTVADSPRTASLKYRRHSIDPPMSCPKPNRDTSISSATQSPAGARTPSKWSKSFFASRATPVAPSLPSRHPPSSPLPRHSDVAKPSEPLSPLSRFAQTMPLPRSVSKEAHSPSHRMDFRSMKSALLSPLPRPRHQSSGETLVTPRTQWTPVRSASPVLHKNALISPRPRKLSSSSLVSESNNQSKESPPLQRQPSMSRCGASMRRRMRLDPIEKYEGMLRELCDRAIQATRAKYAAVSVFVAQDPTVLTFSMAHYLKSKDSSKLSKTAVNMRCCEPVLRTLDAIATRNALTFRVDDYKFASLPFVKGPQQARFYAGVPLMDKTNRLLGALAVFDAKLIDNDEELSDSIGLLESLARATMVRIETQLAEDALDAFMKQPLVRQTEPVLITRRGLHTEDDGSVYSVGYSGDEDDEESIRTESRRTTVPSSTAKPQHDEEMLEFYKRQMHKLVQQAHQTQDQVMRTAVKLQGVSY